MSVSAVAAPTVVPVLEPVRCYLCGSDASRPFVVAEDDLTGKPGRFPFVACAECGLVYQNPRIELAHIGAYYDEEYIAHRKRSSWGVLTPLYRRAMERHDRQKEAIVRRYVALRPGGELLDVGCGAGTFLRRLHDRHGMRATGVDFVDLSHRAEFAGVEFHHGLFYERDVGRDRFDLVTMWHFLEHDYDPPRTLETARRALRPEGRLVIEVPRLDSVSFRLYRERWPGLQAPQHTACYTRATLLRLVRAAGFEVVDYLPYGAFPAYFYLFAGLAFKLLRGRGLDLGTAIYPYFAGQLALTPLLLFERRLNLAMQTVICRRSP
jgi:2-polyprenyl-3-methyl-5-hydroxy-6-metoxy-1,4-benzoquinol methylase